jgi:hypothetical protein
MLEDFLKGNHFVLDLATLPWPWGTLELWRGGTKGVHHPFDGQCGHFGYGSRQDQGVPRLRGPRHLTPGLDTPSLQQPYRPARVQLGAPAMGADAEQRQQAKVGRRRRFYGARGARGESAGAEQGVAATALREMASEGQRVMAEGQRRQRVNTIHFFYQVEGFFVPTSSCDAVGDDAEQI